MKRTTVKIPDDLDARLRHEADRRGATISEITREALERHLGAGGRRLLAQGRVWHSGSHDVSERVEAILGGELSR